MKWKMELMMAYLRRATVKSIGLTSELSTWKEEEEEGAAAAVAAAEAEAEAEAEERNGGKREGSSRVKGGRWREAVRGTSAAGVT